MLNRIVDNSVLYYTFYSKSRSISIIRYRCVEINCNNRAGIIIMFLTVTQCLRKIKYYTLTCVIIVC